jgi:hypothetical protein
MGFSSEIVGTSMGFNWESCGGAHSVALKAAFQVKAQAEAKFHMY